MDVTVKMPRTCLGPTNRANTLSDTVEEYFEKVISIPFLDHLLQEKKTRFTDLHKRATLGLMLVTSDVHKLKNINSLFTYFVENILSPHSLNAEISIGV